MTHKVWAAGDQVLAADLNENFNGLAINTLTTGEAIDGSSTPQAVCIKTSDGKVYKADADDTTRTQFYGFINSNAANASTPYILVNGLVPGFSGLTVGAMYYVTDTPGAISTTPSTSASMPVGIAVSATQIFIFQTCNRVKYTSGTGSKNLADASTTLNIAHGGARIPKYIRLHAFTNGSSTAQLLLSIGTYDGTTTSTIFIDQSGGGNTYVGGVSSTDFVHFITSQNADQQIGTVTMDATNIIIAFTKTNNPTGTAFYLWEAFFA